MRRAFLVLLLSFCGPIHAQNEELLQHLQAILRIDTTDPPGNETKVAEYIKSVFEKEGIPVTLAAQDPARANVIARLRGNGSKRPILLMAHEDTVRVDPAKWKFPPFSATIDGGYVYSRGVIDNKWQLAANIETMLMLKRGNVALDRDVIFVAEAGEEAATGPGIKYLVDEHWPELDAEACIAEGGTVRREGGQVRFALTQTAEKIPSGAKLVSTGPSGHGSRPLRTNAILHLSEAIEKVALWDPPMRFNDTTRSYFEKMATLSPPDQAARFNALFDTAKAPEARAYLAENDPGDYSMLHTSISPTIVTGGFQVNVIPSTAEATLDIRALPDENMPAFYDLMRKVIGDPTVQIVPDNRNARPSGAPSRIDTGIYHAIEVANRTVYGVPTIPQMSTGATDMAFLRSKGMQCYGVGPAADVEDAAKGYGAHSDQERLLIDSLDKYYQFQWDFLRSVAMTKK
ncbi:MAG TPA: M20/M25/M40 family metallo-hydrolase [Bryobacteraceae bacterium]|jgi:acetylornithine deacetylase/succinyl-diaminopimelate desuccinylase-like protein|nr:M20/M25/M40 family metallo-hydrolase [Bryobacteraceae bacterium]